MGERPIEGMMDKTMQKIKEMVDVNTIIGSPITAPEGTIIIPVSKLSYGFVSGGSEFSNKRENSENLFGGGSSAGVTVSPVAFLTIINGTVKLLRVEPSNNSIDRIVDIIPGVIDKVCTFTKKKDCECDVDKDKS
ncbi:MAG: putative spore protein YtfJ [Eubacteriales bacterium SKADARSKE-1]|nr:putative spore protein YtfJ [Eubacteriales bacterium SKADARSKE-1]